MALGWEEVDETELVKGQMLSVVHACIRRITVTKGDNLKDAMATGGQVHCNAMGVVKGMVIIFQELNLVESPFEKV